MSVPRWSIVKGRPMPARGRRAVGVVGHVVMKIQAVVAPAADRDGIDLAIGGVGDVSSVPSGRPRSTGLCSSRQIGREGSDEAVRRGVVHGNRSSVGPKNIGSAAIRTECRVLPCGSARARCCSWQSSPDRSRSPKRGRSQRPSYSRPRTCACRRRSQPRCRQTPPTFQANRYYTTGGFDACLCRRH